MSWCYRTLLRPFLFLQDSETIHNRTLRILSSISRSPLACSSLKTFYGSPELRIKVFGLDFPNPLGLAAGMDKNAKALPAWEAFGFGFTELGGVTWHPQTGNPAPRMFRAIPDRALINRMGFNNDGAEAVALRLAEWRETGRWPNHPVGINLGKSKITPLAEAAHDYVQSFRALWAYADFFVVNVSSPNTPGLRQLQDRAALDEILSALQKANTDLGREQKAKPILVKVAPDLSFEALDEILALAIPRTLAGIVATNTTLARPQTDSSPLKKIHAEAGGLSGRPLADRSTEVIRHIYRQTKGKLPIIGVGGIFEERDAWEKIAAGASLLQIYTGMVYEGPRIPSSIVKGLQKRLKTHGFSEISQVIGTETPF